MLLMQAQENGVALDEEQLLFIAGGQDTAVDEDDSCKIFVPPTKIDWDSLFQPLFDEYFNPPPCVVSPDPVVVAAPRLVDLAGSPSSTTIDQDVPSANMSSEETTLQRVIPSNLHHLNQSFDTLTKLTKNHPLENVIGDPSRPILTRSQLQEHAIWCYFDANDNPIPFGGKRSG
ncbi:hypothetical protein Tco_0245426 [Tanacetum coccineum]